MDIVAIGGKRGAQHHRQKQTQLRDFKNDVKYMTWLLLYIVCSSQSRNSGERHKKFEAKTSEITLPGETGQEAVIAQFHLFCRRARKQKASAGAMGSQVRRSSVSWSS
jgi:hypothetical protein